MFTTYKNINELENAYDEERKQLNHAFNQLDELRHQTRRKCEQMYDHFLYLKHKMNYSEDAMIRMTRIIESFDRETNQRIRHHEMKLEDYKDDLRREYLKQSDRIEGDE
ncbi:TPA: hypothetical protein O1162_001669 [Staphylococcus aureus]|nr:hypothetical protein [Staphylococcus aureus]